MNWREFAVKAVKTRCRLIYTAYAVPTSNQSLTHLINYLLPFKGHLQFTELMWHFPQWHVECHFQQASPFIFTKVNSASRPLWTTTAATPTSTSSSGTTNALARPCVPSQPLWVPLVVGVVSLLVGIAAACFVCSFVLHKRSKREFSGDMKATGL